MEERSLARLRAQKGWTQAQAAEQVGVDERTYRFWEKRKIFPHPSNIERLCKMYSCSEAELGLRPDVPPVQIPTRPESTDIDEAHLFLASDPTMHLLSLAYSPLPLHTMQHGVIKLLEEQSMNIDPMNRREALRRLATLPIAALHLNATMATTTAQPETVLSQCGAGIVACWHLRKGKELTLANSTVSAYLPTLREIVSTSAHYRKAAADLLVQCYLLKAVLSWNVTTPTDGIGYAQQAEVYSQIAEKPILQVAALRAQAAALCYASQWGLALHKGLQAKQIMEMTSNDLISPLTRSYIYAGIATYQAYHQQKQDALTTLKKAHATFFTQSDDEVVPLWIDHSVGNLLLNDGLTHSHLGLYKGAVDSFGQIQQHTEDTAIPFSCRVEIQIEQAIAEVSRDDRPRDMEHTIALWTQGIEGAKSMQSNKHFSNALVAYTAMKAAWPGELRIKGLRELTTHW